MTVLSYRQIPGAIARRETFRGNSMRGEVIPAGLTGRNIYPTGILPEPWRTLLRTQSPTYVVWSYSTPIAWVNHDGTHVIPDVKYSATSSRHQGHARRTLAGPGIRSLSDIPTDTPEV